MVKEVTQITAEKTDATLIQPKKERGRVYYVFTIIIEIFAILFWFYVVSKLFIFDIDKWTFEKFFPNYVWLLNFKFFIVIGVLAIIWLITKNKYFLLWSLYVLFYPLIVIFWKIPFFAFKQNSWLFTFALINAVVSFFKSVKYNFIIFAFFLVSLAIIFNASNQWLLWLATSMIFFILLIIYFHRFVLVFKPSGIFQIHIKIFSAIGKHVKATFVLEDNIKTLPIESLNSTQLERWTTCLETSVLFNRVCLFAAKKLRDYQNSGLNIASSILTTLLLFIVTIFSFAAINFGFYRINDTFFNFTEPPSFFTFFYYSFNTILNNSISEVSPVSQIAYTSFMLEAFFSLLIVVIFASILISYSSQRHIKELDEVIKNIEHQGIETENFIKDQYRLRNIEDAMTELQKLKTGLITFLYKITESIK